MTISQIKYFLAIMEYGSFSSAAEEMYISQSSLSKQIKSLETELGVQLFIRSNNKISLSDAGKLFFKHASTIDATHTQLLQDLYVFKNNTSTSSITLGTLPLIQDYQIASQLTLFQKNIMDSQINIFEADQSDILRKLKNGKIDLAILRLDYLDTEELEFHPIRTDSFTLVVSSTLARKLRRKTISLRDVAEYPLVTLNPESDLNKLVLEQYRQANVTPKITLTAGRHLYLLNLVKDNLGITLLPKDMVNHSLVPGLVCIPFTESLTTSIGIVRLKDAAHPRASELLYNYFSTIELTPVVQNS